MLELRLVGVAPECFVISCRFLRRSRRPNIWLRITGISGCSSVTLCVCVCVCVCVCTLLFACCCSSLTVPLSSRPQALLISYFELTSLFWTVMIAYTLHMLILKHKSVDQIELQSKFYHYICWVRRDHLIPQRIVNGVCSQSLSLTCGYVSRVYPPCSPFCRSRRIRTVTLPVGAGSLLIAMRTRALPGGSFRCCV